MTGHVTVLIEHADGRHERWTARFADRAVDITLGTLTILGDRWEETDAPAPVEAWCVFSDDPYDGVVLITDDLAVAEETAPLVLAAGIAHRTVTTSPWRVLPRCGGCGSVLDGLLCCDARLAEVKAGETVLREQRATPGGWAENDVDAQGYAFENGLIPYPLADDPVDRASRDAYTGNGA